MKIKPSKHLRKAIEVRHREAERLKEDIRRLKSVLDKVSIEDVIEGLRKSREHR